MTELSTRLDGLEMRIAHQDHTIDDLNATVAEQWKQIEDLTQKLTRLIQQVRDMENATRFPTAPEAPPPHY